MFSQSGIGDVVSQSWRAASFVGSGARLCKAAQATRPRRAWGRRRGQRGASWHATGGPGAPAATTPSTGVGPVSRLCIKNRRRSRKVPPRLARAALVPFRPSFHLSIFTRPSRLARRREQDPRARPTEGPREHPDRMVKTNGSFFPVGKKFSSFKYLAKRAIRKQWGEDGGKYQDSRSLRHSSLASISP